MSNKKTTEPMSMKMVIELADNGIIIRDPEWEDDVTLAISKGQYDEDHTDEYKEIGKRVYDWLVNVVRGESEPDEIIVTGFDIDINARCTGRSRID